MQNNASLEIYNKMQALLAEYYVEPENIPTEIVQDDDEFEGDILFFNHFPSSSSFLPTASFLQYSSRCTEGFSWQKLKNL